MTRLERLRQQLADLEARRDTTRASILELAAADGEFTPEQDTEYRSLNTTFDELGPQIEQVRTEVAQLERVANAPTAATEPIPSPTLIVRNQDDPFAAGREYGLPSEVRSIARRAVEQSADVPDAVRAAVERALLRADTPGANLSRQIIASSRPAYRSFMAKYVAGHESSATVEERQAADQVRAIGVGTPGAGGYLLAPYVDPTIRLLGDHNGMAGSPLRQLATTVQLPAGADVYRGISTTGVSASWDGEFEEVSDDSPTFTSADIPVKNANAFVEASIMAWEDIPNLEATLRNLFDVAKDDLEMAAFASTVAPSAKAPPGLIYRLDGTSSEVAPATPETFALADVNKLISLLPARFLGRASFMGHISTYLKIQELAAAADDKSVWNQLDVLKPALLRGVAAYNNPFMPSFLNINTAATADNFILVLGDFSAYTIVDRVGMEVEFVPHLFDTAHGRPKGSRGLFMHWRVGADVSDSSAFRVLNVATTA